MKGCFSRMTMWRCMAAYALLGLCASAASAAPWRDAQGRAQPQAMQAVQWLLDAQADGLRPEDYRAAQWQQWLGEPAPAPDDAAALGAEAAFTQDVLRYLKDLHSGRVDPAQLGMRYKKDAPGASAGQPPPFDAQSALQAALDGSISMPALRQAAWPRASQYAALRKALARYRLLAQHQAWAQALPALPAGQKTLQAGQAWEGLEPMMQRLVALGDAPEGLPDALAAAWAAQAAAGAASAAASAASEAPVASAPQAPLPAAAVLPTYDEALQAAVQAFRQRHGLPTDKPEIDRATLSALEVSPEQRAQSIALQLERLRWTPLRAGVRTLEVNLPEFMLRAWGRGADQAAPDLAIRVIVGKASTGRTPLFEQDMRHVEFSPQWNVPPSIAQGETLPRLRRDPGYLKRQNMELVGSDGKVLSEATPEAIEAVASGQMRIRQRAGRGNALGSVKFVLPNRDNIYLHYTSSPGLFARLRRDFSHGCVRVQDPQALAEFVLQDAPDWSRERIESAMNRGRSLVAHLPQPFPVVMSYFTARVDESGRVLFFGDIYGKDKALEQALLRVSGPRPHAAQ